MFYAEEVMMEDTPVRQPFPTVNTPNLDPFLLLHHHTSTLPAESNERTAGVGPHPHRGFTPITFVFDGEVHHRDSRGNSDIVKAGGVQWMDSGMGIVHSERPSADFALTGGVSEVVQLWVNLPGSKKMMQPRYQAPKLKDIPKLTPKSGKGSIAVYAGQINESTGPVETQIPLSAASICLEDGATASLQVLEGQTTFIYLLDGQIRLEGHGLIDKYNLVLFETEGTQISFESINDCKILLVSGAPIGEKVAQHGPFVMNSETELLEAMRDYQMGKMGILIEDF